MTPTTCFIVHQSRSIPEVEKQVKTLRGKRHQVVIYAATFALAHLNRKGNCNPISFSLGIKNISDVFVAKELAKRMRAFNLIITDLGYVFNDFLEKELPHADVIDYNDFPLQEEKY